MTCPFLWSDIPVFGAESTGEAMSEVRDIGRIEESYQVLRFFGDGGFGDLYVARDRKSGQTVAVKKQKPWREGPYIQHKQQGVDLGREGSLMHDLSGIKAIPRVIGIGTYENDRCIVMEYIEGRSLRECLTERVPIKDQGTVASVIGQLCEILHEVHESGFVHCDLKPENVIVEPDGRLRLIDMGLSVRAEVPTDSGHGSTGYASAPQLEGSERGLTPHADIFGLGCMLLEMTVHQLPYGGLNKHVHKGYPVLPDGLSALIPEAFRDLALQMVEWEPEARPHDVLEVLDRIRRHLPAPHSPRPAKPLRPDPTEYYRRSLPRL
ncbi:serine/threonine protein kinase [Streptomyces sp. NPDC093249]|uniref:serine/threonine protein kinase n=1 Tax=unclassified Streptomyces TaxID=2593676 RepID=UPI00381AFF6A